MTKPFAVNLMLMMHNIDEIIDDIVSYKLRFLKLDVFANINKLGGGKFASFCR